MRCGTTLRAPPVRGIKIVLVLVLVRVLEKWGWGGGVLEYCALLELHPLPRGRRTNDAHPVAIRRLPDPTTPCDVLGYIVFPERFVDPGSKRSRHHSAGMATARLAMPNLSLRKPDCFGHAEELWGSGSRQAAAGPLPGRSHPA